LRQEDLASFAFGHSRLAQPTGDGPCGSAASAAIGDRAQGGLVADRGLVEVIGGLLQVGPAGERLAQIGGIVGPCRRADLQAQGNLREVEALAAPLDLAGLLLDGGRAPCLAPALPSDQRLAVLPPDRPQVVASVPWLEEDQGVAQG
jgi:hypothetical protein